MFVRAVLPFAVVILIAAADPAQDAKKDLERFQGEWTMLTFEAKGKKLPDVKNVKLTIKGDRWTVQFGEQTSPKMTFKIDPSKDPKTIDFTIKSGDKDIVSRGIYKLEGDTLTVCRTVGDEDRPKEFKTTAKAGQLRVWQRAKK